MTKVAVALCGLGSCDGFSGEPTGEGIRMTLGPTEADPGLHCRPWDHRRGPRDRPADGRSREDGGGARLT
ncbi:MAG: hypothetical protein ACPGQD_02630 [Planctomycetota bacterium]